MKMMKTILTGFLAVAMIFSAMGILSQTAEATGIAPDGNSVYYDNTLDIENFWDDNEPSAPVLPGYVFGGWFTYEGGEVNVAETTYTALHKSQLTEKSETELAAMENVCAKFVPAYVLSIKVQIDQPTKENSVASSTNSKGQSGYAFLRLLSSVDTNKYEEIGFELFYDKVYKETENTFVTKVYSKLTNEETGTTGWTPQEIFGEASEYFSVLRVDEINSDTCDNILYVKPYWITKDGTRVTGQSKYVRVMDGYSNDPLISVPVNLMTGSAVAAGMLDLIYDSRLEVAEYDAGLLLPQMASHNDTSDTTDATDTIKFVGNVKEVGNVEPETDIYVNVWFRVKEEATIGLDETLNFTVGNYNFCNWEETPVNNVKAWDVIYQK